MDYEFYGLHVCTEGDKAHAGLFSAPEGASLGMIDVRTAGADIAEQTVSKQVQSGAGAKLRVQEVRKSAAALEVLQAGGGLSARTVFERKGGGVGVYTEIVNLSDEEVAVENVSAVTFSAVDALCAREHLYLYRFYNSHHAECQP